MRPFLSIVLVGATACGDNLISESEGPPVEEEFPDVEALAFVPDVCAVRSWPSVDLVNRDVDLAVAPTPTGAAVFAVDRSGGALRGFVINGRGELETKETGTTIREDLMFTSVSAAYIDERLVTAAVTDDGAVAIDIVRDDLGAYVNLNTVRGTMIADLPIAHAREQRLVTVGDETSLTALRFDSAWQLSGTQELDAAAPLLTMAATRYREDTMVAWSTDATCHLSRISAEVSSKRDFPCVNNRVALDAVAQTGYMVFDNDSGNVSIAPIKISVGRELGEARHLTDFASAPKIVFDGTRYWISYINARQDIVVGYLGANGTLVSMALEGTQPFADGYELAVVGGGVWLFAADGAGIGAQRLCLKPVR